MRNKKLMGILTGVLLAMLAFIAWRDLQAGEQDKVRDEYETQVKDLEPDAVTSLITGRGEASLTLTKAENEWKVGDYMADSETIREAIVHLLRPTSLELVSETAELQSKFGITEESGTITLRTGSKEKKFFVGNTSADGMYVKPEGSNGVYLVSGLPASVISTEASDWVDLIIARIPEETIQRLKVAGTRGETTLIHEGDEWKLEENGKPLEKEPLNPLLMSLDSLVTQGIITEEEESGYSKNPDITVTIEHKESETPTVLQFYSGKEDVMVKSSGRNGAYRLSSTTMDSFRLQKNDLSFKPEASPTQTPTTSTTLGN